MVPHAARRRETVLLGSRHLAGAVAEGGVVPTHPPTTRARPQRPNPFRPSTPPAARLLLVQIGMCCGRQHSLRPPQTMGSVSAPRVRHLQHTAVLAYPLPARGGPRAKENTTQPHWRGCAISLAYYATIDSYQAPHSKTAFQRHSPLASNSGYRWHPIQAPLLGVHSVLIPASGSAHRSVSFDTDLLASFHIERQATVRSDKPRW